MESINKFDLRFFDECLEKRYRKRVVEQDAIFVRHFILLALLFSILYFVKDYFLAARAENSLQFQGFFLAPVYLILYLLSLKIKFSVKTFDVITITLFWFTLLNQLVVIYLNGPHGYAIVSVYLVVVFSCYFFLNIAYKHLVRMTPVLGLILVICIFVIWDYNLATELSYLSIYIMTFVLILTIKYRSEKYQRLDFLNSVLQEQEGQILHKNLDYIHQQSSLRKDLITVLAHDLRSPIASLTSVMDLLSKGVISEEESKEFFAELTGRVNRVNFLIDDILVWIKTQTDSVQITKDTLDLGSVRSNLDFIFQDQLESKGIKLMYGFELEEVVCQPDMMKAVLRNLIGNALKFSMKGNRITLHVYKPNRRTVRFVVKDEGVGMDKEKMSKLQSTFDSTKGTGNETGTGIGLKICQSLVKAHGSKLIISSEPQKGTTISFDLKA